MKTVLLLATLALTACVPTPITMPMDVKPGAIVPAAMAPITTARAVALFDAVCGATVLNDFAKAPARMAENGITVASPYGTPTVYSPTENVSFQVHAGPGFGKTCSMVFGTKENRATVMVGINAINPFRPSELGMTALYRNQKRLVLFDGGDSKDANGTLYHLQLLSDH